MIKIFDRIKIMRKYSSASTMNIFDRKVKQVHRTNNAKYYLNYDQDTMLNYNYVRKAVAQNLMDRLEAIKKDFNTIADISAGQGEIAHELIKLNDKNIKDIVQFDNEPLYFQSPSQIDLLEKNDTDINIHNVVCDEEFLALKPNTYDLIICNLSLHWVNKLPTTLATIKSALKDDGCVLISMYGGESLQELRSAFALADLERYGGVMPHVSPFTTQRDLGDLLSSSGYNLITLDNDVINVQYPDFFTLVDHLKMMGESNGVVDRKLNPSSDVFLAAASIYDELYKDKDDLIEATFHVLYAIGWKPHSSQQKPKERGSASHRFSDIGIK